MQTTSWNYFRRIDKFSENTLNHGQTIASGRHSLQWFWPRTFTLSKVNRDIWHTCWISMPNLMLKVSIYQIQTMLFSRGGKLFSTAVLVSHWTEGDAVFSPTLACPRTCWFLLLESLLQQPGNARVKLGRHLPVRVLPVCLYKQTTAVNTVLVFLLFLLLL